MVQLRLSGRPSVPAEATKRPGHSGNDPGFASTLKDSITPDIRDQHVSGPVKSYDLRIAQGRDQREVPF